MKPKRFKTAARFRAWLEAHHADAPDVWVELYNKASGRGGISYREAVDEALCFGWIDSAVRSVSPDSRAQRFTPRRRRSQWSAVNLKRFTELRESGRVASAGIAAFEAWDGTRPAYSSKDRTAALDVACLERFRSQRAAWEWFAARPPGYQRTASFWVMSAKRPETRLRRLEQLIADSDEGQPIKLLRRTNGRKGRT